MAVACGGLAQLLAGQWEFVCGNTFGATALSSFGAFWIRCVCFCRRSFQVLVLTENVWFDSYALILIPGTGIISGYAETPNELHNALGFFLMVWFIFTFVRARALSVAISAAPLISLLHRPSN